MSVDTFDGTGIGPITGTWTASANGTLVIECWGGGGPGDTGTATDASGGGGGGAYAKYTVAVSASDAFDYYAGTYEDVSTVTTNPGAVLVASAGGGSAASGQSGGAGGTATVGDVQRTGGTGGTATGSFQGGAGGGESAGPSAAGTNGSANSGGTGGAGGTGVADAGDGGAGGDAGSPGVAGTIPGGGGGGGAALQAGGAGAVGRVRFTFTSSGASVDGVDSIARRVRPENRINASTTAMYDGLVLLEMPQPNERFDRRAQPNPRGTNRTQLVGSDYPLPPEIIRPVSFEQRKYRPEVRANRTTVDFDPASPTHDLGQIDWLVSDRSRAAARQSPVRSAVAHVPLPLPDTTLDWLAMDWRVSRTEVRANRTELVFGLEYVPEFEVVEYRSRKFNQLKKSEFTTWIDWLPLGWDVESRRSVRTNPPTLRRDYVLEMDRTPLGWESVGVGGRRSVLYSRGGYVSGDRVDTTDGSTTNEAAIDGALISSPCIDAHLELVYPETTQLILEGCPLFIPRDPYLPVVWDWVSTERIKYRNPARYSRSKGVEFDPYPAEFNPLTLSPALWLKADAGTLQTVGGVAASADGDPVGQWLDQSGNGWNVSQGTAGARPTLKLAVQNGMPAILFDGINDAMTNATFSLSQPYTVCLVGRKTSAANINGTLIDSDTSSDRAFLGLADVPPDASVTIKATNTGGTVLTLSSTFALWGIITAVINSTSSRIRLDGGSDSTGDAGTNGFNKLRIGGIRATVAGGYYFTGYIGEILIFPAALTSDQYGAVEAYLRTRWGTP